jgi:hypothetical protein
MATPPRATVAGRVFNDLRNAAARQGRGTDELLVMYVLERWLYRASISDDRERFILKGGLLLAALDARRPTRDGDLLAAMDRDETYVVSRVSSIAAVPVDDGGGSPDWPRRRRDRVGRQISSPVASHHREEPERQHAA